MKFAGKFALVLLIVLPFPLVQAQSPRVTFVATTPGPVAPKPYLPPPPSAAEPAAVPASTPPPRPTYTNPTPAVVAPAPEPAPTADAEVQSAAAESSAASSEAAIDEVAPTVVPTVTEEAEESAESSADSTDLETEYYELEVSSEAAEVVEPRVMTDEIVVEKSDQEALILNPGEIEEVKNIAIKTETDLVKLAQSFIQTNRSLQQISVTNEEIEFEVIDQAKLFGFIPISYTMPIEVETDGEVEIAKPWWLFLASDQVEEVRLALESDDDLQFIQQNQERIENVYQRLAAFMRAIENVIDESF